jgi:tetratricopeptide (TPR) repeat protein
MMMRMAMHSPSATAQSVQLSRSEIIAKHEQTRLQLATQPFKYTISSIDSKSPGYCDKPLELRSIKIAELKVDTVHVGRVLTCRTVTSPLKYSATVTVVEDLDNSDTVLPLYIYNDLAYTYNGTKSSQELFDLLPPGTVLKIKEPYCKTGASGYKTIRVDEPHNVVQLSKRLERLGYTTCQQYRSVGDSCYTSKNYESAVAAYDEALKIKPGDSQSLLNRASALSAIGKHHHALDDLAAFESSGQKITPAFHLRRGNAYFAICLFTQALLEYGLSGTLVSQKRLAATKERIVESTTGKYKNYNNKSADYVGPVELKFTEGKGRGLFLTRDVAVGDLIMTSTAACIEEHDSNSHVREVSSATSSFANGPQSRVSSSLAAAAINDRLLNAQLTNLYDGSRATDVKLKDFFPRHVGPGLPVVTKFKAANVVKFNGFVSSTDSASGELEYTGLWILPSLFNHNCAPNVKRSMEGAKMYFRAAKSMKAGTELCISYAQGTLQERSKTLISFGIRCSCKLCESERRTAPEMFRRRRELNDLLNKRMEPFIAAGDTALVPGLSDAAKEIEKTYLATDIVCKHDLSLMLNALVGEHCLAGEWTKVVSVGSKYLVSMGMCSEDALKHCDDLHSFDLQYAQQMIPAINAMLAAGIALNQRELVRKCGMLVAAARRVVGNPSVA